MLGREKEDRNVEIWLLDREPCNVASYPVTSVV